MLFTDFSTLIQSNHLIIFQSYKSQLYIVSSMCIHSYYTDKEKFTKPSHNGPTKKYESKVICWWHSCTSLIHLMSHTLGLSHHTGLQRSSSHSTLSFTTKRSSKLHTSSKLSAACSTISFSECKSLQMEQSDAAHRLYHGILYFQNLTLFYITYIKCNSVHTH
jgi:hypothetical protein